jgi:mannose-6-phosphate isomerase class I
MAKSSLATMRKLRKNTGNVVGQDIAIDSMQCPGRNINEMVLLSRAKTKEEFAEWVQAGEWGNLLKYLPAKKDHFIDIPAGTLHAINFIDV